MKRCSRFLFNVSAWLLLSFLTLSVLAVDVYAKPSGNNAVSVAVLPFAVNGGQEAQGLRNDLPQQLGTQLASRGLRVVPYSNIRNMIGRRGITELNLATVKMIAAQLGAEYAVYGSLSSIGDAFSIDARMVSAASSKASRSYFTEKKSLLELPLAVEELAGKMAGDTVHSGAIADIRVRGLRVLDADAILMRLSIRKGDPVDLDKINDEVKKIWNLGYFSDVRADIESDVEGKVLVFTVQEKPKIEDVVINGSEAVKKDDILAAMSLKTGSVMNERLLSEDIQKIMELYRKEGYYLVEISHHTEARRDGSSALLVFDVKEGNKLYIKEVKIEGLDQLDEGDVKKQLALQERGILSWFTGTGVLREEHMERDTNAITVFGWNQGFVDIRVSAPEISYEEDGIIVTFRVNEGIRYKLGEIGFRGDLIDTEERLFEVIALDEHKELEEYWSATVMNNDIKALTDYYSNFGYAYAEVNVDTRKNMEEQSIDVIYAVTKKQKVFVRRVNLDGNMRTRDNVILRELRLADGDVFDGSKLRRTNERLTRLRYFSDVDSSLVPADSQDEVDLKVSVKEDNTGMISAGVGYSTYYSVGVSGTIMERNLFGRGYQLALTGFLSKKSAYLDLSFANPRLYDTDLGFTYDAYVRREEWDDFEKKTIGNTMRFIYPLGEYTSASLGYRLDRYTLYNIPEQAPHAYKDYEGKNLSSVVSAGVGYDSTDNRERPTRGHIAKIFLEYGGGGLGGNDNFFKPMIEGQGFYTLFKNPDHIFHLRGRLGGVFRNTGKTVPVFDRFFIGGIDSIRGYDSDDIAPKDPEYNDELGGDRMGFVNVEYIWTFHKELGLALVPFFDAGFNVDSRENDAFTQIKKSVGLELRWRSPMGDLRFAYGYPLDKNVDGRHPGGRFEFSMGQFF
ncbi:MAG: outer membrane protein assembly factor BamA [Desulfovibrionaceae bacterium]|nr:outer membrane protein assembly factor BamA [Desulfovibrionaceae bacterium]